MLAVRSPFRLQRGSSLRNLAVFILVFLLATRANAQGAREPLRLSLSDAVERALNVSEEVLLAESDVEIARQQVRVAEAAAKPQIEGSVNYLRTIRSPFEIPPEFGAALPFGRENTWVARIDVNQVLWAAGRLVAGRRIAEEFLATAGAQRVEDRSEIALQTIEAYYGAVVAGELVAIATAARDQVQAEVEHVRLLRRAGNASDLEVLRVEVERANIEPQIVQAQNTREIALLNLKRLTNIPAEQPVILTSGLQPGSFRQLSAEAIAALVAGAVERRAAVEAAERLVAIREQQIRLARAAFYPTAGLSVGLAEQAQPDGVFPAFNDFRSDWSAGVGLRIPIYDGGRRRAELRIAEWEKRQAEWQLAQVQEGVALEVERFRGELERASALLAARAETARSAARVYELTVLSFRQGVATNLQVTDARTALRQARANEAQAVHDYYIALARLLRSAGATQEDAARLASEMGFQE